VDRVPQSAGGMEPTAMWGRAKKAPRERQNFVHMHLFAVERSWGVYLTRSLEKVKGYMPGGAAN
jgi:hypothetical protein